MKTKLALLCLMTLCQTVSAQIEDREADKQALRILGSNYEKAINAGNLRPLANSLTTTASAVFMTGDEFKSLDAMQAFFDDIKTRLGPGSSYTIKLTPDDTQFFGEVALAHGKADESVKLGNGSSFNYTTRWTAVLRKIDGIWKAERLHVSLNPIDNPIANARSKAQRWFVGITASISGIVVGFLLSRVCRK